ncbi:Malonyl CoA-acyl carrier protein transacylase [Buchnera aphidicola (Pterocallis alni)]|uniref:ACP S-malonyltransferase n=1 Tax=Buchnera aphidicola TaxID=9 RepID=UPI003464ACFD
MPSFAMIFPGQGSHKINILHKLYKNSTIIQNTFLEASNYLNYNLWKLINTSHYLNKNQYIQPLILVYSVAIYRLWKKLGGSNPNISSGHSLGEYAALVCAKIITFSEAVKLVAYRGKIMEKYSAKQEVQMQAIIGLNKKIILKICKKYSYKKIVNIASINSKKQIIISGHKQAVQNVSITCKKNGAHKILNIPVNIAAHCYIMRKLTRKLSKKIKKIHFQHSTYPVISSISVKKQASKHTIRKSLIKQLYKPVQWYKTINLIKSQSNIILELGMNNILINLIKKRKNIKLIPMNNLENIYSALNLTTNIK